jgi:S-adenosylmethionine-diacylgycerolhomoserine-N-methlytransferase
MGGDHAALMDKVYRRQRHIYDFTRKYYLLGRDRLVRELHAQTGERIVEIGCGTARNLIRMARAYPGVQLYGLDASREMLRTAEDSVRKNTFENRIVLTHGFAEQMTPALFGLAEPFDRAVFSYSLSMIPDWRGALRAAADAVKPEGLIYIVDFGDLGGLWPRAERALRAWLKLFHVSPQDELLTAIERGVGASGGLNLLACRYAFILRANPGQIRAIAASDKGFGPMR